MVSRSYTPSRSNLPVTPATHELLPEDWVPISDNDVLIYGDLQANVREPWKEPLFHPFLSNVASAVANRITRSHELDVNFDTSWGCFPPDPPPPPCTDCTLHSPASTHGKLAFMLLLGVTQPPPSALHGHDDEGLEDAPTCVSLVDV